MSAVATVSAPTTAKLRIRRPALLHIPLLAPVVVTAVNAIAFLIVRPNVGDLQAALARQDAASSGVGLTYWFQWFGGGTTPGHYSVLSPFLSSLLTAPLSGALATLALTPLTNLALADTRLQVLGTWIATFTAGLNLWSGRIPFALGCAFGVVAVIGVRRRSYTLALAGAVISVLFSPVTGAFVGIGLLGVFLVEVGYRRLVFVTGVVCGAAMIFVAFYFGTPGPQDFQLATGLLVTGCCWFALMARPAQWIRVVLWMVAISAPLLAIFPNGMGSNYVRLPWIILPVAVVATARSRRWLALFAVLPSLICCAQATVVDLKSSRLPAASASYYNDLIARLGTISNLANYRLEVVQSLHVHTAAYTLIRHVALPGGYETQEQNEYNSILKSETGLNAVSYKIWLDDNAVGYVALDKRTPGSSPEYKLVASGGLRYLHKIWENRTWRLFRVEHPTPIVAPPEVLVSATQSALTVSVPCACTFHLRVRYSKFLTASEVKTGVSAEVTDDLTGWTVVTTTAPGTYVLKGRTI